MICEVCGTEFDDKYEYCPNCGTEMAEHPWAASGCGQAFSPG